MNHGIKTIVVPVSAVARATALYSALLGVEPYMAEPYYVGYRVGDQEIGLDPNGHNQGMTGPVSFSHVDDVKKTLQLLLDTGAHVHQEVKDVGRGN